MAKKVKQPTIEEQKELMDVATDAAAEIFLPNRKRPYKILYLKPYTTEKVTRFYVTAETLAKETSTEFETLEKMSVKSTEPHQAAAYIILNNFFKIKLFHWILWRYLYYIKEYNYGDLFLLLLEGKKKIQSVEYSMGMACVSQLTETKMGMTTKEAKAYQTELSSVVEAISVSGISGR